MTDKQTSAAAEKAALEHLSRHKEMGIEYSDSGHIGIFLAGVKWGRQEERQLQTPEMGWLKNVAMNVILKLGEITGTPQWINVEDKLPERRKGVLLYHDVWGVTCGHLSQTSPEIVWRDERGDNIETSSVLYWMPLPAVPEGINEK